MGRRLSGVLAGGLVLLASGCSAESRQEAFCRELGQVMAEESAGTAGSADALAALAGSAPPELTSSMSEMLRSRRLDATPATAHPGLLAGYCPEAYGHPSEAAMSVADDLAERANQLAVSAVEPDPSLAASLADIEAVATSAGLSVFERSDAGLTVDVDGSRAWVCLDGVVAVSSPRPCR